MKSAAFLAASISLLCSASAKVTGFAAPSHVGAGDRVKLIITTDFDGDLIADGAIDVAMTFGLADGNAGNPAGKGQTVSAKFLGFDSSNINENITHYIYIPSDWPQGMGDIAAVLFEQIPLDGNPNIPDSIFRNFKLGVTVGPFNSTSTDYLMATEFTPPPINSSSAASAPTGRPSGTPCRSRHALKPPLWIVAKHRPTCFATLRKQTQATIRGSHPVKGHSQCYVSGRMQLREEALMRRMRCLSTRGATCPLVTFALIQSMRHLHASQ